MPTLSAPAGKNKNDANKNNTGWTGYYWLGEDTLAKCLGDKIAKNRSTYASWMLN